MLHQSEAEENLRVIRSLMEKATVYRAISAPGALVAGVGAVLVAAGGIWRHSEPADASAEHFRFVWPWVGLFFMVAAVNLVLLARDARRRGEPFVSPGMRLALRAMLPALLGGGAVALPALTAPPLMAAFWVLFFGIGLLAAAHFAPKSICWLGRAFFVAGFALFCFATSFPAQAMLQFSADAIMGATFGLFHLIYAACTWPRGTRVRSEA